MTPMALTGFVATFRIGGSPPGDTWVWFLLCGGGLLAYVAVVAAVAALAKWREDGLAGRRRGVPRRTVRPQ